MADVLDFKAPTRRKRSSGSDRQIVPTFSPPQFDEMWEAFGAMRMSEVAVMLTEAMAGVDQPTARAAQAAHLRGMKSRFGARVV